MTYFDCFVVDRGCSRLGGFSEPSTFKSAMKMHNTRVRAKYQNGARSLRHGGLR